MKINLQQQCVRRSGRVAGSGWTFRKHQRTYGSVIGAAALALVPGASAQLEATNKVTKLEGVTVVGRAEDLVGVADSATQGTVGQAELARRPLLRPGEVLETVPGGFNLDRFGTLDPDSGGSSWRGSLSGEWHRRDDRGVSSAIVYGYHYGLDLFSNFTGALNQTDGDEIFQPDRRFVTGTRLSHTWLNEWDKRAVETKLGLDVRADIVSAGLFTSKNRDVLTTTRDDHATTVGVSPYLENKLQWTDWFRTVAGVRGDIYPFDVDNEAGGVSRSTTDAIASPKLNLIFGPWADTEFYLYGGLGFHTADARGTATATDRADVFTQQQGAEFGIRTRAVKGLQSTLSFWVLDSDDETVFVGDAGTTEPSGRKGRRYGVEFANFYDITPWLALDADVSLSRARFRDHDPAGDHIPDAVESVVAVGLSVHDLHGFFGSIRLRYFGARALIEDDSVRSGSSTIVNLQVGYQINKTWSATVDVLNLFDARVNDQEYYYSSRLPGEPAGPEADGGYLDRHVHPAEPLTLRVGLPAKF